jgi:cysteinyl-tRNA synthetase
VLVSQLLTSHSPAAVRLLLLSRRWSEGWDYDPAAFEDVERQLDALYAVSAIPFDNNDESAEGAVLAALRDDLNVPQALDIALESGGSAARALVTILGLR